MIPRLSLPERLKQLPDFDPPADGWSRLADRLERRPPRRSQRFAPLALAASVSVAVIAGLLLMPAPHPDPQAAEVAQLMQRSRQLESTLEAVRPQVVVWNGALAATAARLRNDVAVVDLQLSYAGDHASPAAVRELWKNRVELMSRLVQTHEEATLSPTLLSLAEEQSL